VLGDGGLIGVVRVLPSVALKQHAGIGSLRDVETSSRAVMVEVRASHGRIAA
jgi:hypothetical protein